MIPCLNDTVIKYLSGYDPIAVPPYAKEIIMCDRLHELVHQCFYVSQNGFSEAFGICQNKTWDWMCHFATNLFIDQCFPKSVAAASSIFETALQAVPYTIVGVGALFCIHKLSSRSLQAEIHFLRQEQHNERQHIAALEEALQEAREALVTHSLTTTLLTAEAVQD
jgi:hypothetical protein